MHRARNGANDPADGGAVVFCADTPVADALPTLDLDRLRRTLADLMDAAAAALQRSGYDFDDVLVTRFVRCSTGDGTEHEVEAVWLADRDRLVSAICAALPGSPDGIQVNRAGVRVRVDPRSGHGLGVSERH